MLITPNQDIRVMALETSCKKSCPHCFIDPGQGNFRQAEKIAQQAHDLGYEAHFYATAVSPRCDDIYKRIDQDTQSASICVRGESVSGNVSWLMAKNGRIGFSLHGASQETHELLAGANTFDITVKAIKQIAQHNPTGKVNIWCAIHRKNKHEIRAICEQARELGAAYLTLVKLSYLGRARQLDEEWFLDASEVAQLVTEIEAIVATGEFPNPHISLAPNWGMSHKQAQKFSEGQKSIYYPTQQYCPAGRQRFAVDGNSLKVYPCHFLAADERFAMGQWSAEGVVVEDDTFLRSLSNLDEPCVSCELLDVCGGGCRAEAIAEHLRLTGEINFQAGFKNCRKFVSDMDIG